MSGFGKAALLASALVLGCSAEGPPDGKATLSLRGTIDAGTTRRLSEEIAKHPLGSVVLEVQSPGGDALAAMDLGDVMRRRGVFMVVKGYCHSACSQYLMPSAATVTIEGKASIAFHGTPSWIALGVPESDKLKSFYAAFRAREESFLSQRGIDYRAWLWVQSKMIPICVFVNANAEPNSPDRYGLLYRNHIVAPSKDVMKQLGYRNMFGAFPSSASEAKDFAVKQGFRSSIAVAFVDTIHVPKDWQTPKVPPCMRVRTDNQRP
jgi:hypothetical protein